MILADAVSRKRLLDEYREMLHWDEQSLERRENLEAVLATADDERFPGALLPRPSEKQIDYYAITDSGSQWRALMPLLTAFLGVTFTDFIGRLTPMRVDDPIEQLLTGCGFQAISRFSAGEDPRREAIALRAVLSLRRCLERSEAPARTIPRATNHVLWEFDLALAIGDRKAAEEALAFLQENMRLDALNLHFLVVQMDAALREWGRLRTRSFFESLCQVRRPPHVTAALAEAIYQVTISPAELENDPTAALERFQVEAAGRTGNLFAIIPSTPSPAVGKSFLVALLAVGSNDETAFDRLSAAAGMWPEPEARFFKRLLELAPARQPRSVGVGPGDEPFKSAVTGFLAELDAAKHETSPATLDRARAVLIAATAVQTIDAYRTALEYLERVTPSEREVLRASLGFGGIWADIAQVSVGGHVPRDWGEWISMLPMMDFAQARRLAEQAVTEWPIAQHLSRAEDVNELASALTSVTTIAEERLNDALPHMVAWVQSDDRWPNPDYQPLYEQMLEQLLLSTNRTPLALGGVSTLFDGLLSLGVGAEQYRRVVGDVGDVLPEVGGVRSVDWVLDIVESTVVHPCLDEVVRAALWVQAELLLSRFATRLTPMQLAVLSDLGSILGLTEALTGLVRGSGAAEMSPDTRVELSGFLVAIYTLTEGVGQRVARALRDLHPGIRVQVLQDLVNSPRLQDLARNADLFVISWLSATHAATTAIRQARPGSRTTIYPSGKGSSSLLREIEPYLLATAS